MELPRADVVGSSIVARCVAGLAATLRAAIDITRRPGVRTGAALLGGVAALMLVVFAMSVYGPFREPRRAPIVTPIVTPIVQTTTPAPPTASIIDRPAAFRAIVAVAVDSDLPPSLAKPIEQAAGREDCAELRIATDTARATSESGYLPEMVRLVIELCY